MQSLYKTSHLLDTEHLSHKELNLIFDLARKFKNNDTLGTHRGTNVGFLFHEASTRTKGSFLIACKNLGINVLDLSPQNSSFVKGESLVDTAENLIALGVNLFVIRHNQSGIMNYLSEKIDVPIINGGDGMHAHPTQALLDAFTLIEHFGSIENKKVSIIGDIKHSRVARSNIHTLKTLGAEITVIGPKTFIPIGIEKMGVNISYSLDTILESDIIMALRIQKERQLSGLIPSFSDYASCYGIKEKHLTEIKSEAVIMHPGPVNRGIEISGKVADSKNSLILEQTTNGIFIRMAVISLLLEGNL